MGTPACEHAIKPGEWNDLEITEEGAHYVTRLNGVPCVDFPILIRVSLRASSVYNSTPAVE